MIESRKVVVTGLGAISALGHTVEENWAAAKGGRCGISKYTLDPGKQGLAPHTLPLARVTAGYQAPLEGFLGRAQCSALDSFAAIGLCAAFEALRGSSLHESPGILERAAVVMGHGFGGLETLEIAYERFYGERSQ